MHFKNNIFSSNAIQKEVIYGVFGKKCLGKTIICLSPFSESMVGDHITQLEAKF